MKKRFVALMMMVAMTATLVACSGKDAPKENTTAGTNDSAVEATTGTTTQDVAESNEETTTPDVSEVEEDQVGETSVGTVGGLEDGFEVGTWDRSDEYDLELVQTNDVSPEIGKIQVNPFKSDKTHGTHHIFWNPLFDSRQIVVSYDGKVQEIQENNNIYVRSYLPDDTMGFVTVNIYDTDFADRYGFNMTRLTYTDLGDLSSDEAWQKQLDRTWTNENGTYLDEYSKNEKWIYIIRDATDDLTYFAPDITDVFYGYELTCIRRDEGIEYTFFYGEVKDEFYDDNYALSVVRSFGTGRVVD